MANKPQQVGANEIEKVTVELAVKRLVQHIKEEADLDDLAKMYSWVISDNPIVVEEDGTASDPFKDGEPVEIK